MVKQMLKHDAQASCSKSDQAMPYERTHALTQHLLTLLSDSNVDQRAQGGSKILHNGVEIEPLRAGIAALIPALTQEPKRHPVHRTSKTQQRQPIDPYTRKVVYTRDHYRCVWCGKDRTWGDQHRLVCDHITTWSSGGTDHPDNLRTLCWNCNETRSNFHSPDETWRRLPITVRCIACADCACSCADCQGIELDDPRIGPAFCYWHLKPTVGLIEADNKYMPWRPEMASWRAKYMSDLINQPKGKTTA